VSPAPWNASGAAVPTGDPSTVPSRVKWEQVQVGLEGEPFTAPPLSITDFVRYQGASGDFNPIHHDEEFAKAAGFPTVFAVGMLQAGLLGTYLTDWFGPESVRRLGVRFKEQVWPGDVVTLTGVVSGKREEDGDRLVDLELTCTRQTSGVAISGWATVALG
jgi:acyl dehydratase